MSTPLPPWTRQNSFQQNPHQRVVDRVNETSNITAPAGGEVLRTPYGTGVAPPLALRPWTDYSLFIDSAITGAGNGGRYLGRAFHTKPASGDIEPGSGGGIDCEIWVDDEILSTPSSADQHWSTSWQASNGGLGIGRFMGEYNFDDPPKPIMHAAGFGVTVVNSPDIDIPNQNGQAWQRDAPYVDPTNGANHLVGDCRPRLKINCEIGGVQAFRHFTFDASGRLFLVDTA